MKEPVKTLAGLNRRNQEHATAERAKLNRLLANGEIALLAAQNFKLATITGIFFDHFKPASLLGLAQDAERELNNKGTCARRHNAKRSRQALHRIGPAITPDQASGIPSFRLPRTINGFIKEHLREDLTASKKQSWSNLSRSLAAITDGGLVQLLEPTRKNKEIDLRTERYSFKVDGKSYEISFGQFEKHFTDARKAREFVAS